MTEPAEEFAVIQTVDLRHQTSDRTGEMIREG